MENIEGVIQDVRMFLFRSCIIDWMSCGGINISVFHNQGAAGYKLTADNMLNIGKH